MRLKLDPLLWGEVERSLGTFKTETQSGKNLLPVHMKVTCRGAQREGVRKILGDRRKAVEAKRGKKYQ